LPTRNTQIVHRRWWGPVTSLADDFKLLMLVARAALPLIFLLKRARAHAGETAILE
jgi:hypothetical protein